MTGLKPMGLIKKKEGQWNLIVARTDRTQTNGINLEKRGGSTI